MILLAREVETYNRKTRAYERIPVTMTKTAKEIGVSVRTLRRWKNENVTPAKVKARSVKKLVEKSGRTAATFARTVAKDRKTHKGALRIDALKIPYIPQAHRRKLKRYAKDRKSGRVQDTGEEYESPIINYNVRGWNFKEIAALIFQIWKARRPFQFVYEVPAGGNLPASGQYKARRVMKTTRASTAPINPYWFTDPDELVNLLNRYIDFEVGPHSRRIVYISVDDGRAGPTKRPSGY